MENGKYEIIFSRRHEKIADKLDIWRLEADSYAGGEQYKNGRYLHKFPLENDVRYKARLKRSVYFNHVQPIADMLAGFIFATNPERNDITGLEFLTIAASKKKGINEFMQSVAIHSLMYPIGILVDSPSFDPDVVMTVADRNDRKLNPYCVMYRPESVRDFSTDEDGEIEWILLDNTVVDKTDPFKAPVKKETYRLWTKTDYTDFMRKDEEIIAGPTITHALGEVPFIFVNWRDVDGDNISESIFEDIALLDQAIYNFISLLDEMITAGTFQVLFWPGDELPDTMLQAGVGSLSVINYDPANGGKPFYDGAKLGELSPFLTAIELYIKELLSKVGLDKDHDKMMVQSGVAKGKEFEKAEALLRLAAEQLEGAEKKIFHLAALWQGGESKAQINYIRKFQREDVDVLLTRLYELLTLPIETVKKRVYREILSKVFAYLDSKTLEKLLKEAEEELEEDGKRTDTDTMVNLEKGGTKADESDEQYSDGDESDGSDKADGESDSGFTDGDKYFAG